MLLQLSVLMLFLTLTPICWAADQDTYMEAYQDSHSPNPPFIYGETSYKMPDGEEMQSSNILPHFLSIASVVAKIMLKLTLFKIIVKFVAIVCLFLFIPTLKLQDSSRKLSGDGRNGYTIEQLTGMIDKAIEKYSH